MKYLNEDILGPLFDILERCKGLEQMPELADVDLEELSIETLLKLIEVRDGQLISFVGQKVEEGIKTHVSKKELDYDKVVGEVVKDKVKDSGNKNISLPGKRF